MQLPANLGQLDSSPQALHEGLPDLTLMKSRLARVEGRSGDKIAAPRVG